MAWKDYSCFGMPSFTSSAGSRIWESNGWSIREQLQGCPVEMGRNQTDNSGCFMFTTPFGASRKEASHCLLSLCLPPSWSAGGYVPMQRQYLGSLLLCHCALTTTVALCWWWGNELGSSMLGTNRKLDCKPVWFSHWFMVVLANHEPWTITNNHFLACAHF